MNIRTNEISSNEINEVSRGIKIARSEGGATKISSIKNLHIFLPTTSDIEL
jgi:hypothetical protein